MGNQKRPDMPGRPVDNEEAGIARMRRIIDDTDPIIMGEMIAMPIKRFPGPLHQQAGGFGSLRNSGTAIGLQPGGAQGCHGPANQQIATRNMIHINSNLGIEGHIRNMMQPYSRPKSARFIAKQAGFRR